MRLQTPTTTTTTEITTTTTERTGRPSVADELSVRLVGGDGGFPWETALPLIAALVGVGLAALGQYFLQKQRLQHERDNYFLTEKRKVYAELLSAAKRVADSYRRKFIAEYERNDKRGEARTNASAEVNMSRKHYDDTKAEVQFLAPEPVFQRLEDKQEQALGRPSGAGGATAFHRFAEQWDELASAILDLAREDMGLGPYAKAQQGDT